jgi:hypothetical protein
MAYDPSHPTDKDKARFALGDTSNIPATELLSDTTINAELGARGYAAGVAFLARGLATRFARKAGSVTLPNGLSMSWPKRVERWQTLAKEMDAQAAHESVPRAATGRARNIVVW